MSNIQDALDELKMTQSLIESFKEKNNWKLLGFEIPIANAIKSLEQELGLKQ